MTENNQSTQSTPIVGRTVWDIAVASSYIMGGFIFVLGLGIVLYLYLDNVPTWFFIAIVGSLFFIPFLMDRAKSDADLYLISNESHNLTEYRIGKRYGLNIEGSGVLFKSKSGVSRTLLTEFDQNNKTAKGSTFGSYTQIDQVRDLTTLNQLSKLLEDTLRETRISSQTVGVEVEKQSKIIVDWALKTIYGAIIPNEISEIFGVEPEKNETFEHKDLTEIIEEGD